MGNRGGKAGFYIRFLFAYWQILHGGRKFVKAGRNCSGGSFRRMPNEKLPAQKTGAATKPTTICSAVL
jgi:hypothetical protein